MTNLIAAILVLITLAVIVTGTIRHGWTWFYLVPLCLILVAGAFVVLA